MRVCIVGASGKLGRYMVQHALDRGHERSREDLDLGARTRAQRDEGEAEDQRCARDQAAGVADALDATIVRGMLVPATVSLLGRWNWWLPQRAARLLRVEQRSPGASPLFGAAVTAPMAPGE